MDGSPHRFCGISLKGFRCGESLDVLRVMRIQIAGLIPDESDDCDVHACLVQCPDQPVPEAGCVRPGRPSAKDMRKRFMGHDWR